MDYFHSLLPGGYSQELQQLQIKKKKKDSLPNSSLQKCAY